MAINFDVMIVGNNLNSQGFVGYGYNVSGLGLNTFGFLFPCDGIWTPIVQVASTTWTGCTGPINNLEYCDD